MWHRFGEVFELGERLVLADSVEKLDA